MAENTIITISRKIGSGGSYVGRMLAKRLGIKYVDREILRRLSVHLQEDEKVLATREERVSGFWERVMQTFSYGVPEAGYVPPPLRPIPDQDLFAAEEKIIKELTEESSAVIMGRAGFHILKGRPKLVNILLHAPDEFRIRRIMEMYDIADYGKAAEMVDEIDGERKEFIRVVTGLEWLDASNYHLCIDTEAAGFTGATETIMTLVGRMLPSSTVTDKEAKS